MLDKLKSFLETPEGIESVKNFFDKINRKDIRHKKYYKLINQEYIDKVYHKYCNKPYHSRFGNLLWNIYDYAKEEGIEATDEEYEKYGSCFTSGMYKVYGRFIERMDGQGSEINVF